MLVPNERVSSPSEFPYSEDDYRRARNIWSVPKVEVAADEVSAEVLEKLGQRYKEL